MAKDYRSLFNPDEEVPNWFWALIHRGYQDRDSFQRVCQTLSRKKLIDVMRIFDEVSGFFTEAPFRPSPPVRYTLSALEETGYWVISQGKQYFRQIWDNPKLFWELVDQDIASSEP